MDNTYLVNNKAFCVDEFSAPPTFEIPDKLNTLRNFIFAFNLFVSPRKQPIFRDATTVWFPREMTSEKRAQKFLTNDASLTKSG